MITLPDKFRKDIELQEASIYPVVHWDIQDLILSNYKVILSTHPLNIELEDYGLCRVRPVIEKVGNIQESIDINNKKFTTSSFSFSVNNRDNFIDQVTSVQLIGTYVEVYFVTQSCEKIGIDAGISDGLMVYKGAVTKLKYNKDLLQITLEDQLTKQSNKKIPVATIPTHLGIKEDYRGKAIPMIYGNVLAKCYQVNDEVLADSFPLREHPMEPNALYPTLNQYSLYIKHNGVYYSVNQSSHWTYKNDDYNIVKLNDVAERFITTSSETSPDSWTFEGGTSGDNPDIDLLGDYGSYLTDDSLDTYVPFALSETIPAENLGGGGGFSGVKVAQIKIVNPASEFVSGGSSLYVKINGVIFQSGSYSDAMGAAEMGYNNLQNNDDQSSVFAFSTMTTDYDMWDNADIHFFAYDTNINATSDFCFVQILSETPCVYVKFFVGWWNLVDPNTNDAIYYLGGNDDQGSYGKLRDIKIAQYGTIDIAEDEDEDTGEYELPEYIDWYLRSKGRTTEDDPANIMKHILVEEVGINSASIHNDSFLEAVQENMSFDLGMSVDKQVKARDLIANITKNTRLFVSYSSTGKIKFNSIKLYYEPDEFDVELTNSDVIKYSYSQTKRKQIYSAVDVKYGLIDGEYTKSASRTSGVRLSYPQSETYYQLEDEQKLDFQSKFIQDDHTAILYRNFLLNHHKNPHLIIDLEVGIHKGLNLETGDIVKLELLEGTKGFGIDYSIAESHNGTVFFPLFMVIKTSKTASMVKLQVMQLHFLDPSHHLSVSQAAFESAWGVFNMSELSQEVVDPYENWDPSDNGDGTVIVYGCMDLSASNYDVMANVDDGSCEYEDEVLGCTDEEASNYDPNATEGNADAVSSCQYIFLGCTDPEAANYDPDATEDDGSCVDDEDDIIEGCTDPDAENYDETANEDDGSCIILGCTDPTADNWNPNATAGNPDATECDYPPVYTAGCMDPFASNFDPDATIAQNQTCTFNWLEIITYGDGTPYDFDGMNPFTNTIVQGYPPLTDIAGGLDGQVYGSGNNFLVSMHTLSGRDYIDPLEIFFPFAWASWQDQFLEGGTPISDYWANGAVKITSFWGSNAPDDGFHSNLVMESKVSQNQYAWYICNLASGNDPLGNELSFTSATRGLFNWEYFFIGTYDYANNQTTATLYIYDRWHQAHELSPSTETHGSDNWKLVAIWDGNQDQMLTEDTTMPESYLASQFQPNPLSRWNQYSSYCNLEGAAEGSNYTRYYVKVVGGLAEKSFFIPDNNDAWAKCPYFDVNQHWLVGGEPIGEQEGSGGFYTYRGSLKSHHGTVGVGSEKWYWVTLNNGLDNTQLHNRSNDITLLTHGRATSLENNVASSSTQTEDLYRNLEEFKLRGRLTIEPSDDVIDASSEEAVEGRKINKNIKKVMKNRRKRIR